MSESYLVIGATSAIAKEVAELWAKKAGKLYLIGRSEEKLKELSRHFSAVGATQVNYAVVDFQSRDTLLASFEEALKSFAQKTFDRVLIAHGVLLQNEKAFSNPIAISEQIFANYESYVHIINRLLFTEPPLCKQIVAISSVAGERGRQSNPSYCSSKAALTEYLEGLRPIALALGVSLLTVKPGIVVSPMTQGMKLPQMLVSQPKTVARQIVSAAQSEKKILYTPGYWFVIMTIIKALPRFIFDRLKF